MQARYQYGNLTIRKRKKGPDVWQFRWMENGKPKSVLIGTVEKSRRKRTRKGRWSIFASRSTRRIRKQQFHTVNGGGAD